MKKLIQAIATALFITATAAGLMSCGDSATAPTSCPNGPYSFDANVQRCRATNGQFAANACCGRQ